MSMPFRRFPAHEAGAARTGRALCVLAGLLLHAGSLLATPPDAPAKAERSDPPSVSGVLENATECVADGLTLCLQGNRFRVQGTYLLQNNGGSGSLPMTKRTDASGTFTFSDFSDVQAVVKVLNACDFNNRFWVFIGPLTNQQVTVNITDMKTGAVKVYFNPLGTPFQPIQDIDAFATCP